MKFIKNRILALLLMFVLLIAMVPAPAAAADSTGSITIHFVKNSVSVPNANFKIYKVASVDVYGNVTLTSQFSKYSYISGLNNLKDTEGLNKLDWLDIAGTLSSYVQADKVVATKSGKTGTDGKLKCSNLSYGWYLIMGDAVTYEKKTYTPYPFMVAVPCVNETGDGWIYDVTVVPKSEVKEDPDTPPDTPPGPPPTTVSRKVEKVWDDKGFETLRPTEIEVQLLRNGTVHDTQKLNKDNNWRYTWDKLDSKQKWTVVEKEQPKYVVKIQQQGITFLVTNTYVGPHAVSEPIVNKGIPGDKPENDSVFTFTLKALDKKNPMPEGSTGDSKTVTITGAGSVGFGEIMFKEAGTYIYEVTEVKGNVPGYTYDETVYTVIYKVTKNGDDVKVTQSITSDKDSDGNAIIFENPYKTPMIRLPQTGVLWWPVPVLLAAGLLMIVLGILRRRGECNEI